MALLGRCIGVLVLSLHGRGVQLLVGFPCPFFVLEV